MGVIVSQYTQLEIKKKNTKSTINFRRKPYKLI